MSRHHHDALFRQVFSDRAEGAGLLRLVLPERLLGRLRLGTLRLRSESFVDEDLASRQADLLYSVQSEEGPCLVYVLFEHQSTVDPSMPFRMLRYVLEVQRQEARSRGRGELLPAVLPVVVYHGPRSWSGATEVRELIDWPAPAGGQAERWLPSFSFWLLDLSECSDGQIEGSPLTARGRLALLLLKHARQVRDLVGRLEHWAALIAELHASPGGRAAFQTLLMYILHVRENFDHRALAERLGRIIGPQMREEIMSTARQLREEGIREGLQLGIQKGIQKGIEKGIQKGLRQGMERGREEGHRQRARAVLVRLLEQRFGSLDEESRSRIESADLPALERWTDRILEVDSPEQLFED